MTQGHQLQCPDCGDRHDLDALGDVETFRCSGCGRALKVPLQVRAVRAQSAPPSAGAADLASGAGAVAKSGRARATGSATRPRSLVALWVRLIIWVVAVPFGLAIVFGGAVKLKWVTRDELVQTFTGAGWDRFAPVAKLLPIAALIAATVVQLLVMWLEHNAVARRDAASRSSQPGGAADGSPVVGTEPVSSGVSSAPDGSSGDARARGLERFNTR